MSDRPTWLFVCEAGDSSCAYYRATIPVMGLRQLGYPADLCSTILQRDDGRWTGIVEKNGQRFMIDPAPDVLVVRRLNGPDGKPMRTNWHDHWERGQHVFIDVDDDPWNLPEHNPAFGVMTPEELEGWSEDMATASLVIASTDALRLSVERWTDAPSRVCRNGIDARIYRPRNWKQDSAPVRLGWLGTTDYRGRDLAMIVPALRDALKGRKREVEFWHLGARNDRQSVNDILGPNFPVRVVEWPWVPIHQLPYSLAQIDCAVVPMEPGPFNEARSNVTGLALLAAGVPFVSSRTAEYERLGGTMAESEENWARLVRAMVNKKAGRTWRINARRRGLETVREYTPQHTANQYLRLLGLAEGLPLDTGFVSL